MSFFPFLGFAAAVVFGLATKFFFFFFFFPFPAGVFFSLAEAAPFSTDSFESSDLVPSRLLLLVVRLLLLGEDRILPLRDFEPVLKVRKERE